MRKKCVNFASFSQELLKKKARAWPTMSLANNELKLRKIAKSFFFAWSRENAEIWKKFLLAFFLKARKILN